MKAGNRIYLPALDRHATVVTVVDGQPALASVMTLNAAGQPVERVINVLELGLKWSLRITSLLTFILKIFGRG